MRRPIDACLDAAAPGTAKPRQPQCHLSEQRRDRVVTIIFHPANPIAAGANRPPDRVLPRLRGGDLALNPREQLFRFREGQSQIGDIAEVIRLADFHDVQAGTVAPRCRQLQNPLHAPPPVQEKERKYPARTRTPSFAVVPGAMDIPFLMSTIPRSGASPTPSAQHVDLLSSSQPHADQIIPTRRSRFDVPDSMHRCRTHICAVFKAYCEFALARAAGNVIRTVVPCPRTLSIVNAPPCRVMSLRLIESPRPVPPYFLLVEASAWIKGSPSEASVVA